MAADALIGIRVGAMAATFASVGLARYFRGVVTRSDLLKNEEYKSSLCKVLEIYTGDKAVFESVEDLEAQIRKLVIGNDNSLLCDGLEEQVKQIPFKKRMFYGYTRPVHRFVKNVILVSKLRGFVQMHPFVAVTGNKNCGKSTLVKSLLHGKDRESVKAGSGNENETLIPMIYVLSNGVNLLDLPGFDGANTSGMDRIPVDLCVLVFNSISENTVTQKQLLEQVLLSDARFLTVFLNQADLRLLQVQDQPDGRDLVLKQPQVFVQTFNSIWMEENMPMFHLEPDMVALSSFKPTRETGPQLPPGILNILQVHSKLNQLINMIKAQDGHQQEQVVFMASTQPAATHKPMDSTRDYSI